MTKLIAAAAIAGFAGTAFAQEAFTLTQAAYGPNAQTAGIANFGPSSGAFINNLAFGNDATPNPALIPVFPDLEFDSYVAIGGSTIQFAVNDGVNGAAGESNNWFTTSPAASDASFSIFVGRFSVESGAILTGSLSFGDLITAGESAPVGEVVLDLPASGLGLGAASDGGLFAQPYQLRVESVDNGGLISGDTYDVFVQAVPAPGAAGLLGLAGLAAARRRRA